MCCSVLQCVAVCCSVLQWHEKNVSLVLQVTATQCNILQHTATRYNTLQHTATHCNKNAKSENVSQAALRGQHTVQVTPTNCNMLQHTATHCVAVCCSVLRRVAPTCTTCWPRSAASETWFKFVFLCKRHATSKECVKWMRHVTRMNTSCFDKAFLLQCVAVCYIVLQFLVVRCIVSHW